MKCRVALPMLMLGLLASRELSAQDRPVVTQTSPIMDMIESAKAALNNLQYTRARTTSREVLALGKLKRSQEIAALEVASASYYPDDNAARMPDSAAIFLRKLARLMPTGPFPADIASPALDSQFAIARKTTFGASARAPLSLTLKGTEMRPTIEVVSTRPARWQLYLVSGDGGPSVLVDTLPASTTGRLSLRAHTGTAPVFVPGQYQLRILGISASAPDTILLAFDGTATGSVPALMDSPAPPDARRLLPERAPRAIGVGIAGALMAGGATWALANAIRPPDALGKESKDNRALPLGIAVSIGAILGGIIDHGKPIPENIRANAQARSDYLKQLGDVTETNHKRVGDYTVALTIDPELK
jgi:hypothetical protein